MVDTTATALVLAPESAALLVATDTSAAGLVDLLLGPPVDRRCTPLEEATTEACPQAARPMSAGLPLLAAATAAVLVAMRADRDALAGRATIPGTLEACAKQRTVV
jgi:hypothetical protein